ncbi:hypothetical protein JW868_00615 [Candidatus Woesearchaeota archaeon]|nr:hypothetical protein [Candidatus Woesearchaeota archaeon]
MAQELDTMVAEVAGFLKQNGFAIFIGGESPDSKKLSEIVWDNTQGTWKDFLNAAKASGAKIIVVDFDKLKKSHLEDLAHNKQLAVKLQPYFGKFGTITLFWVQNGIKYLYSDTTPWWDELSDELGEDEEDLFDDEEGDDSSNDDDDSDDDSDDGD